MLFDTQFLPILSIASNSMTTIQILIAALAAVVLFLYGLQGFSREVQSIGGARLQAWLGRFTASRFRGFLAGALTTAVVQSSSATTSLTVALVDSGAITFWGSLGLILGANVGTTATAWLVSFKLTGIGPWCIVAGAIVGAMPFRLNVIGKALFYFGFIFFALDLIGSSLKPLHQHDIMFEVLALADVPWRGVLMGLVLTAIIQSSSVTTGLAIVLVQQGVLPAVAAIPIVIGANVGSTFTALLASMGLNTSARRAAWANFTFNALGVAAYFPFLEGFSWTMITWFQNPSMAVAWAHLLFNVSIGVVVLIILKIVEEPLRRRFPSLEALKETG